MIFPDDLIRFGVLVGVVTALYLAHKRGKLRVSEYLFIVYCFLELCFYAVYYLTDRFATLREFFSWLPAFRAFWVAWAIAHYFKFRGLPA